MSAPIDRRIEVINSSVEQLAAIHRVSELRSLPFVVLLGEPGIGKSTVFEQEAKLAGDRVLKVRQFMTAPAPAPRHALFLDALDEYRTDGNPSDKAYGLAAALARAAAGRWRLSCRSEDWRKEADIAPIEATTNGEPIVVAHLLPLDDTEAAELLVSLGEQDPETFLIKARTAGAHAFIESPLSLKLLRQVVVDGNAWPTTRFDLFWAALQSLAFERNVEHKWRKRHSRDEILNAAAETALLFLGSGARAIWMSNDEPPADVGDARAYITSHDLGIDPELLGDTLDTPIFRGDGEAFEPSHRTLAEYLAGWALARATLGGPGRAALPLTRATALITGDDGRPPTELRGLYAWFATHLSRLGDEAGAMRLIESDASTVLSYGDAAVFSIAARRAMLASLGRHDPYFLSTLGGVTAFGALAREDMASDFAAILSDPCDGSHRLLGVFEILTNGAQVNSLRPLFRDIALDRTRLGWQRCRAADAWLNGVTDQVAAIRELFDASSSEAASRGRAALRVHLAADLPLDNLSTAEIKGILTEYESVSEANTSGGLFALRRALEVTPRADLFDEPVQGWLGGRPSYEVESLLEKVFVAAVRKTSELTASRLWQWTVSLRVDRWSGLPHRAEKAAREWLASAEGRECDYFDAILADEDAALAASVVRDTYIQHVGKPPPSLATTTRVLARAVTATSPEKRIRFLLHAAALMRDPDVDADAYWLAHEAIAAHPELDDLLKTLESASIPEWRLTQRIRTEERLRAAEVERLETVSRLSPHLSELRSGRRPGALSWAAQRYFETVPNSGDQPAGVSGVSSSTDATLAEAILEGWEHLATKDVPDIGAAVLGTAEARGEIYDVEWGVIAGLDYLHEVGRAPDLTTSPIVAAIIVLRSASIVQHSERRARLQKWAADRLNLVPDEGAAEIMTFWNAALDAGATRLTGAWELTENPSYREASVRALERVLVTRRVLPPEVLRRSLHLLAKSWPPHSLLMLAMGALDDTSVVGELRKIWSFTAFLLDPSSRYREFVAMYDRTEIAALFADALEEGIIGELNRGLETKRSERETITILLLGATASPTEHHVGGRIMRPARLSDAVRTSIDWLSSQKEAEVGKALATLMDNPDLATWGPHLSHAQSIQARVRRDSAFRHPTTVDLRKAIAGGPPVNASDLRATVGEILRRLGGELHVADTTPWKQYWNTDRYGRAAKPRVENQCRDHILERLRDRLRQYGIGLAVPEARLGEETRVDMLISTWAGRTLPIEVKRHYHTDVWTAASTQLQGYAAHESADGFGMYLVLWFGMGDDIPKPPARSDGKQSPRSALEWESVLCADLPEEMRMRTDVIVFDVSRPAE